MSGSGQRRGLQDLYLADASSVDSQSDALEHIVSETDGLSVTGADLGAGLQRIASESGQALIS